MILLHAVNQFLLRRSDMGHRVNHQCGNVHIGDGVIDDLYHIISQTGTRLMQTRRVLKDKLAIPFGYHTGNPGTGCLGLIGYNRNLGAHQLVEQGGFSHIRLAYNGNDSALFYTHVYSPDSSYFSSSYFSNWSVGRVRCRADKTASSCFR